MASPDDAGISVGTDLSDWGQQDVAIAAYLMLLWKDMYPARSGMDGAEAREWDAWGRPQGGFIDLGCVSPYGVQFVQSC
jgi:tRNASer (uridine44-2'-O)-methyltransferase